MLAPRDWRPGVASRGQAAEGRDSEHERPAAVTLSAGLDLQTGRIHRAVEERHGSRQFVRLLRRLDRLYPAKVRIQLVPDKCVACVTPATRAYLGTRANRFEFIFAPAQGSWLSLVEAVFAPSDNHAPAGNPSRFQGATQAAHRIGDRWSQPGPLAKQVGL